MTKNIFYFVVLLIVGTLLGTFFGRIIVNLLPQDSKLKTILETEKVFGLTPTTLDLEILILNFGLQIKLSIMALLGILISALIFRKFFK